MILTGRLLRDGEKERFSNAIFFSVELSVGADLGT